MTTGHSSKDETCMHVFLYTTNTGLRERAPCPWCLETKVAALERENAVLEENAIRFREERDRLRQSQSHEPEGYYVEELCEGRWSRCALGFMWAKEDDARTQLEELRRRYGGRCFRLHGDYSSETKPSVETFRRSGPELGMSTMCECGATMVHHIAQDHLGNACVCPSHETKPVEPLWRPIAQAPRDGTWVLVAHKCYGLPVVARWHDGDWLSSSNERGLLVDKWSTLPDVQDTRVSSETREQPRRHFSRNKFDRHLCDTCGADYELHEKDEMGNWCPSNTKGGA